MLDSNLDDAGILLSTKTGYLTSGVGSNGVESERIIRLTPDLKVKWEVNINKHKGSYKGIDRRIVSSPVGKVVYHFSYQAMTRAIEPGFFHLIQIDEKGQAKSKTFEGKKFKGEVNGKFCDDQ